MLKVINDGEPPIWQNFVSNESDGQPPIWKSFISNVGEPPVW